MKCVAHVRRDSYNNVAYRVARLFYDGTSRRRVAPTADNDPHDVPSNGSEGLGDGESHRTQITLGMCNMPSTYYMTLPVLVIVFLWPYDGRCAGSL